MKILFAASEAAPYIKSGGLGDVAQALPEELARKKGNDVRVFLPYYSSVKEKNLSEISFVRSFSICLSWRTLYVGIFQTKPAAGKPTYYFIDNEYYFRRPGAYGYLDDGERYAFFSKAVLEALSEIEWYPEIIHCNDWQTALIPVFVNAWFRQIPELSTVQTVFTIHNVEYQGKAPLDFIPDVLGLSGEWRSVLECDGCVNLMKAAIVTANRVTTVSETYARELLDEGCSHELCPILCENAYKLSGITNGINTGVFDPASDETIPCVFSPKDLSGKAVCKATLQQIAGLPRRPEVPVIAMISRLVAHKGLELLEQVIDELMQWDIQMVILGTGEERFESLFRKVSEKYPDKLYAHLSFDARFATTVYAGADLFLMPSRNEPCGLSQMIAMRYGTVPVVRKTGGLADTVPPYDPVEHTGLGFTFQSYNAWDMLDALHRALDLRWNDPKEWKKLMLRDMRQDNSWKRSGKEYAELYKSLS